MKGDDSLWNKVTIYIMQQLISRIFSWFEHHIILHNTIEGTRLILNVMETGISLACGPGVTSDIPNVVLEPNKVFPHVATGKEKGLSGRPQALVESLAINLDLSNCVWKARHTAGQYFESGWEPIMKIIDLKGRLWGTEIVRSWSDMRI